MNIKEKFIVGIITVLTFLLCYITSLNPNQTDTYQKVYQVYLDGKKLGLIYNKEELLALIDEKQQDIKSTYQVDEVYPPNGFEIKEYVTHNETISSASDIYSKIENVSDFTLNGYIITITKPANENEKEKKTEIQVLDEQVFKDALEMVVTTFVDEKDYQNYINNTQEEIKDVGRIINHMYFEEDVSIRESNVSVDKKIFTDKNELSKYLLYGTTEQQAKYIVKQGDTLATIAQESKLNVRELLIANPKLRGENTILNIGERLNNDIINPIMTLVEEVKVTEDVEIPFEKKTETDDNMKVGESKVTQVGVTGLARTTQAMRIINGENSQETNLISSVTLREKVDEITTNGPKASGNLGHYVDNGQKWAWPTNQPYYITTYFEYRWGSHHDAIDISMTGFGSPIYAAADGVVVDANDGCPNNGWYGSTCGMSYGNYLIINHGDNYYAIYGHLTNSLNVHEGDKVKRGQVIAYMGNSGSSTGTHLHFGMFEGYPHRGGKPFDPMELYK